MRLLMLHNILSAAGISISCVERSAMPSCTSATYLTLFFEIVLPFLIIAFLFYASNFRMLCCIEVSYFLGNYRHSTLRSVLLLTFFQLSSICDCLIINMHSSYDTS